MIKIHIKYYILSILLLGWISPVAADSAHDFGPVGMGEFYQAIPAIPANAKPGTLLKIQKIPTTMQGVNAWKIACVSTDINEHKTVITALVAAPAGNPSLAGRPIVAWAHGTTGTAQTCGPSQVINPAQPLNQYIMPDGNSWTDLGLPAMNAFIKAGYVIVATDYQGLGGGGKHQYAVAGTQARDVINSIRAASLIPEAQAGTKAVIYGWSQGGGAALAAASLTDYLAQKGTARDGITLAGFVALAPFDVAVSLPDGQPDEKTAGEYLQRLQDAFTTNIFDFTHYAQNTWGMVAAFPELQLEDIFTAEGAKIVDEIFLRKCMHVASDTFSHAYGKNYRSLLRPTIRHPTAWFAAQKKGSVLPVAPMAPVIIYYGNHDITVPPVMGKLYYDQMCKLGGNITRVQLPGDQDHFSTPASAEPFYVKWIADRFAGRAAKNGCKQQK